MTLTDREIREYFASPTPWLWDWQDRGQVVAWATGETIAFRLQIEAVLKRLESQRLPPFGTIVLLLAACRRGWSEESLGDRALKAIVERYPDDDLTPLILPAFRGLNRVHASRVAALELDAAAELVAFACESARGPLVRGALVGELLTAFRQGLGAEHMAPFGDDERANELLRALAPLAEVPEERDVESLRRRIATGLQREVLPAPIERLGPLAGEATRQLIRQLQDDQELGGAARLARLLLAAVPLPRPLDDDEELPLGGVSDISNRGALDRLMLSELAHDDLTLATRVAMNEALYLRREPLERPRAHRRLVLVDTGVRMWGVPRVFATSVALAVAAEAGVRLDVNVWRAAGEQLAPVDLASAEGVTAQLAALDVRVHPGAALERFAALARGDSAAPPASCETLIVTGEDVWNDDDFRRALDACGLESTHLALVRRDGGFRLLKRSRAGVKTLREARFELDAILAPRARAAKAARSIGGGPGGELPAIFRATPFPFRLSYPVQVRNSWLLSRCFTLTSDGRLLHWDAPQSGATQLLEGLPEGRLHWAAQTGDVVTFVIGRLSQRGLYALRYDLVSGERNLARLDLPANQPLEVLGLEGVLLVAFADQVAALDPVDGRLLDYLDLSWPRHGRFTCDPNTNDRFAYVYDGRKIRQVLVRKRATRPSLISLFDTPAGPVGLTADGEIVDVASGERKRLDIPARLLPCHVVGASRDGRRLAVGSLDETAASEPFVIVDVETGVVTSSRSRLLPDALEQPMSSSVSINTLRARFSGIAVDVQGRLTLVSPRGSYWPLSYCDKERAITLPRRPSREKLRGPIVRFETYEAGVGAAGNCERYSLAEARWPDGSCAILDGRGLLHLRSSRRDLPELSIVLVEGATSGWASDGARWGSAYFITKRTELAVVIDSRILKPFIERLS